MSFTSEQARRYGEEIGIDWESAPFDVEQFRIGMERRARARIPRPGHQRHRRRPDRHRQDRSRPPERVPRLLHATRGDGGRGEEGSRERMMRRWGVTPHHPLRPARSPRALPAHPARPIRTRPQQSPCQQGRPVDRSQGRAARPAVLLRLPQQPHQVALVLEHRADVLADPARRGRGAERAQLLRVEPGPVGTGRSARAGVRRRDAADPVHADPSLRRPLVDREVTLAHALTQLYASDPPPIGGGGG